MGAITLFPKPTMFKVTIVNWIYELHIGMTVVCYFRNFFANIVVKNKKISLLFKVLSQILLFQE